MRNARLVASLAIVLALGACVVGPPPGPTVLAIPAPGKDPTAFRQDDLTCRGFAASQTGYLNPSQAAAQSAVGSAAVGTLMGAAAGALIGAAAGNPGAGAAIGAGSGLVLGSAAGAGNAYASAGSIQAAYDGAYTQCMVAHGNTVRRSAGFAAAYPYYPAYAYPYGAPAYGYPPYAAPWGW